MIDPTYCDVAISMSPGAVYSQPPFDPPCNYPEFEASSFYNGITDEANVVYSLVREALFRHLGGYDPETGQVDITVLRRIGDIKRVVIKPNWVRQQDMSGECVTTHGSVLRPIIDYLMLAFGIETEIIVADIPLQSADLKQIWAETGINALRDHYATMAPSVSFLDLRREISVVDHNGFIVGREKLAGDPLGYVEVSLGSRSFLEPVSNQQAVFSVNDYEPGTATCYHQSGKHNYLIPKSVLKADLFVDVPKLKTHCKAGITCCMKNLIGINAEKAWIPHFRLGAPNEGGDEYPDTFRRMLGFKSQVRNYLQGRHRRLYHLAQFVWEKYRRTVEHLSGSNLTSGGAWAGNDTLWRSILDLVKVILFADSAGTIAELPQRKCLCLVDAIICGEGDGPLTPSPKPLGMIICASNPIIADLTACHVAGFDWRKIQQLSNAVKLGLDYSLMSKRVEQITVSSRQSDPLSCSIDDLPANPFKPPAHWIGTIEKV